MLDAAPALSAHASYPTLLASTPEEISPGEIRQFIADLVRQNRLNDADLLSQAVLARFPESEDILIIRALVSEVRQDWASASVALEKLLSVQGRLSQAVTWVQWVRVLRCDGQLQKAFNAAFQALEHHPGHPVIASELAELEMMGAGPQAKAA